MPPRNLDDVGVLATFRPPLPSSEPVIRVRVLRTREPSTSPWRIGREGQWLLAYFADPNSSAGSARKSLGMPGPIQVEMTARGWSIVDGRGFVAAVGPRDTIEFVVPPDESDEVIAVARDAGDERRYRGTIRMLSRHDLDEIDLKTSAVTRRLNGFDVINDVPLETYLPGVLAGELYASWKPETFAAQAVAARSFACTEAAIFNGRRHFDVSNTASSQMYLGEVRHDRAHEAVAITRGKVLAYDNLLVSGYYSSCCGGTAASAADAIGSNPVNNVPPLHGRSGSDVCVDAPVYRWTIEQPVEQLARRIAGYARDRGLNEFDGLQRVRSIDISAVNVHGRPTRMAITDQAANRVEMTAEDFRRAANFSDPTSAIKPPEKELRSSNVRASITGARALFEGFGFGHGVGLCQYGAEALARGGMAHEDIVRWYYPQVELVTAYA